MDHQNLRAKYAHMLSSFVRVVHGKSFLSPLHSLQHMFDVDSDTCWNSGQGSPQFILIDFTRDVQIHSVQIMFQGGFVGQDG
jgi:hypothetical protein